MKIQIRKGLFETNSSSAHTLVYSKNDYVDPSTYKGSALKADIKDYGRYYELLTKPGQKLSYILTILNTSEDLYNKYFPFIRDTLVKHNITYTSNDIDNLKNELAKGIFNPKHILSHAKWYCKEILQKPYNEKYYDEIYDKKCEKFKKKFPNFTREQKRKYWPTRVSEEQHLINNFKGTVAQKQQLIDANKQWDWDKYEYIQVDHQSRYNYINKEANSLVPELENIVCNEKNLLNFLFNPKSFIIVDYDENSDWWKDFKEAFASQGVSYDSIISPKLLDLEMEEDIWVDTHGWDIPFPKEQELRDLEKETDPGYFGYCYGLHVIE